MSNPNRQRRFENHIADDRINNLPDAILSHILSFVPTKSAVKTSILSKRWKFVWTKVPTLDFTEMPLSSKSGRLTSLQRNYFKSFMAKVLVYNDMSYIQRLCFDVIPRVDDFYVNSWLSTVARREVREINIMSLSWWRFQPLVLPAKMLSGERLVVLKLDGWFAIDAPMPLHLPNIETIHLIRLQYRDDEFMKSLLSGCPVLKELLIARCRGIVSKLYVESLTLKSLKIKEVKGNSELGTFCIVIRAPSLRYLAIKVREAHYDVGDLNSLVEVNLDVYYGEHTIQLLRKVSGVKILRFRAPEYGIYNGSELPIFGNLTCLKDFCDYYTCKLLKCAPNLKSLIIKGLYYASCVSYESESPKCLSCLERVELYGGDDEDEDMMALVAYILKEALVLKEMRIHMDCIDDPHGFYQNLLMLPRSSSACQVKVVCC